MGTFLLKKRYRNLIKQLKKLAAIKEKGLRKYRELNKHIRLR
jgi:hypothetical protein